MGEPCRDVACYVWEMGEMRKQRTNDKGQRTILTPDD